MPLSWNEIKDRALRFSKEWEGERRERAEKDTFWNQFFHVFGISRRRVATFEAPVKKLNNNYGFIDLFWKGKLLVEHKSGGEDLGKAYTQALDYFTGLKEHELPKYVLVSDFARFKLYDLDDGTEHEFLLSELIDQVHLFGFIAGWEKRTFKEEDPVNIEAAELMGKLHDRLAQTGYTGHDLEVYLVRLLFCLFADDTGIFERGIFEEYIRTVTKEDGSDLSYHIAQLFQTLDTPQDERLSNLDESIAQFPYVNGQLFEENVRIASFDSEMRDMFLDACTLDWGEISPAIFGSMFQAAMNPKERRNLGAHYTSEKNILKVIKPLFLDDLWADFEKAKRSPKKLRELHQRIGELCFLDPACGSGNFLIITYRELRQLELEILRLLNKDGQMILDIRELLKVSINQFYGIEYEEFASKVAEVGMWLVEHQMNEVFSLEFGQNVINLPLADSANIVHGNALRIEWEEVVSKEKLSYIIGNPPFIGKNFQTKAQKEDIQRIYNAKGVASADYVTCWFIKAAEIMQNNTIETALVSTNSITQGEQVSILWKQLFNKYKIKINFCHKTFKWQNEASRNAAVHVVIMGIATFEKSIKTIFEYSTVTSEPHGVIVKNISPYLIEGADLFVAPQRRPIQSVQPMINGSKAVEGGNLILSYEEKINLEKTDSRISKYIKPYVGSVEYINNKWRWCLWLKDASPAELKSFTCIKNRLQGVREMRTMSTKEATRRWADFPYLFIEDRQPESEYLLIPRVSSENRKYIPIGFLSKDIIINDRATALPNASLWTFGIITSIMHMSWMKHTCGRMKSDYNYSNTIVYNNYPWPKDPSDGQMNKVESVAQVVLDTRSNYPDSSLADLYDPLTMPPDLIKAHQALDKAVDQCYRKKPFANERERIEFLFELYEEYTAPLFEKKTK